MNKVFINLITSTFCGLSKNTSGSHE